MAGGIMIEFGPAKKSSLADKIAGKIPPPGKLRKKLATEGGDESEGESSAAAEAAFEAFAEAVSSGNARAGVKAFRLMQELCSGEGDMASEEEDEEEEY